MVTTGNVLGWYYQRIVAKKVLSTDVSTIYGDVFILFRIMKLIMWVLDRVESFTRNCKTKQKSLDAGTCSTVSSLTVSSVDEIRIFCTCVSNIPFTSSGTRVIRRVT